MKKLNYLLGYPNMYVYQDDDYFKFSLDSVLLSHFVTINLRCKNIIDLASGNAPIPMLLSLRTKANIKGIELQKCIYDMGIESIKCNNLDDRIEYFNNDVKDIDKLFDSDYFDVVTCNPPYFKVNEGSYLNDNSVKTMARHEISLSLDDVCKSAVYLLKTGGVFAMVHRSERFIEIVEVMKKYKLEPKKVRFIYPKKDRVSDLVLIEGVKNGNSGLKILSPLVIYNDDNKYSIYFVDPKGFQNVDYQFKIEGFKELFEENGTSKVFKYKEEESEIEVEFKLLMVGDILSVPQPYKNYCISQNEFSWLK